MTIDGKGVTELEMCDTLESSSPLRGSFRWFLVAWGAAIIAYQMVAVAVGWQICSMTHRALDLGLVGWK